MKSRLFGAAMMAAIIAVPVFAQDDAATKKGKGKRAQQDVAAQLIKQLEEVKLTDEQVAKIKELGKKANTGMKTLRDEAGITPELVKKRTEAQKSLKDSGKKGKELTAAINEAAGFSTAQAAAMEKVAAARVAFQKEVIKMLSDEQKEKLPQVLKRVAETAPKAKARKKKQDN